MSHNQTDYKPDEDIDWVLKKRKELLKDYCGKFLIIKDKKIVEVLQKRTVAEIHGEGLFGCGNFIVYHVSSDDMLDDNIKDDLSLLDDIDIDKISDEDD